MKRPDGGFTLIELLLAMMLGGVVLAVTATAFMVSVRSTDESTTRLSTSLDGGFASSWFGPDVQSSQSISTSTPGCPSGSGDLVIALAWTDVSTDERIDYRYELAAGGGQLTRHRCGSVNRSDVVARSLMSKPVLTCVPSCTAPSSLSLQLDGADADFTATSSRRLS